MSEHETETGTGTGTGQEATEAARELADANRVDLTQIRGTGADGKITKADVEQHISGDTEHASAMPPAYDPPSVGGEGPKVWEGASSEGGGQ